jgi:3D (Asp-Asp-Asp) domain-containing protein
MRIQRCISSLSLCAVALIVSFSASGDDHSLEVTATAYNSLPGQGQGDPSLAAWGDTLKPGMKAIAVSRDLIPLGLRHRTVVKVDGLPDEYRVLDKLAKRWSKRIDIYMGEDIKAARKWGKRQVTIRWETEIPPDGR